jgi:hypothetical protein
MNLNFRDRRFSVLGLFRYSFGQFKGRTAIPIISIDNVLLTASSAAKVSENNPKILFCLKKHRRDGSFAVALVVGKIGTSEAYACVARART